MFTSFQILHLQFLQAIDLEIIFEFFSYFFPTIQVHSTAIMFYFMIMY